MFGSVGRGGALLFFFMLLWRTPPFPPTPDVGLVGAWLVVVVVVVVGVVVMVFFGRCYVDVRCWW